MWTGACEFFCMAGASLPKSTGRLCNSVRLVGDERYLHQRGAKSTLTLQWCTQHPKLRRPNVERGK